MKKKSPSSIGSYFRRMFDLRRWSDWDRTKINGRYLWQSVKKYFVPQDSKKNESFESAKVRMNLSEPDLLLREKALLRLCLWMCFLAFCLMIYALFNLYQFHLRSFFASFMLVGLALTLAFRYHFWYFQIKARKLGCSIREWYQQGLRGKKND